MSEPTHSGEQSSWTDFNDAPSVDAADLFTAEDTQALRGALVDRLDDILGYLLPQGRTRGGKYYVGDLDGNAGKSLVVELAGSRRGLWQDFATGEGGDLFDLWAAVRGLSARAHFPELIAEIRQWLGVVAHTGVSDVQGHSPAIPSPVSPYTSSALTSASLALPLGQPTIRPKTRVPVLDELGPYTAKWDYQTAQGELIACVYRYDPPDGKEFRPWDVRARLWRTPDPRPLYNQPALSTAKHVILVEGEKCAEALIRAGLVATTAMNGAHAPVDKTDWLPLKGKHVLIWPDRDAPGWDYAESAARACVLVGCASVAILVPPTDKPEKWDAADAVAEGLECAEFIAQVERRIVKPASAPLPMFTLGELLDDQSPTPDDLIAPRVLTPGGLLVFGGAPKVGKSDLLLAWLAHMSAGASFLGMTPPRPLKVFYLQAEVQYHYLRERVRSLSLPASRLGIARTNLVATPQLHLVLNEPGLARVIPAMASAFAGDPPDIIAIDPIRNVFDGGEIGGENDNGAMLFFLSQRVDRIRREVNIQAGIILAHHTRKLGKKQFEEDPFQALAGAGSLRGYYSSGLLLYRADETQTVRQLMFELRNGPGIATKQIDKVHNTWQEIEAHDRLVTQAYGQRLDAERRRKRDVILQILFDEALQGRCYTANQFAETFEGKAGLGGERTIRERMSALSTQGYIKFFRDALEYGLPPARTRYGYLCVEGMVLRKWLGDPYSTGEFDPSKAFDMPVLPTHYKCPQSGAALPVENPETWVYQDPLPSPAEVL